MVYDRLLPGLLPARYRGIPFDIPDSRTEVGRRVAEHLFPGMDRAAYDDHGLLPDLVTVEGLVVGDDYVAQAKRLRRAFIKPGPATLWHPWLGPMTVIMEVPAEIAFSASEIGVARVFAVFKRVSNTGSAAGASTASAVEAAATALSVAASALAAAADRSGSGVLADAIDLSQIQVARAWTNSDDGTVGAPAIGGRAAAALQAVLPSTIAPNAAAYFENTARLSAALIGLVPDLAPETAIAPAAEAPAVPVGLDPAGAAALARAAGNRLTALADDAPSGTDRALLVAAAADALAAAARVGMVIDYESRADALAVRGATTDGLDTFAESLEPLGGVPYGGPASTLNRAARSLAAAVVADVNEVIGRLPAVAVFTPDRDLDAFVLAQHVYGDTPDRVEAGYEAIVRRNRPRHPAALPAGPIEVLR